MGLLGWFRAFWQRDAIPPPGADTLGAATLAKEKAPNLSQESLPHVVIDTRGGPVPEAAVELVKKWEGFRAAPYRCPAGVPTIGYGATRYTDGEAVCMDDEPITEAAAMGLLRAKMAQFAVHVDRLVRVPLRRHERAALISFTFNVGQGALAQSTLLRKLNAGDRAGAANEFQRWNRAGSSILEGLTRRRAEEEAMFRGAV